MFIVKEPLNPKAYILGVLPIMISYCILLHPPHVCPLDLKLEQAHHSLTG
jgi:hypothetical protein